MTANIYYFACNFENVLAISKINQNRERTNRLKATRHIVPMRHSKLEQHRSGGTTGDGANAVIVNT